MSEAIALPTPAPVSLPERLWRLFPGVALLFVLGYAGKVTEQTINAYGKTHHVALPNIEYVLWAILFGLAISNTVGVAEIFKPGIATYDFWLKAGIVLLGSRFLLGDVLKLGGISLALVAIELVVAIGFMSLLGKWFKLKPKLTSLLAIGSSICGVSAIIAAKGAIDADDDDATFAIAAILALGAFGLFAYPALGHLLHMSEHAFGMWAGLAVDNTAEAAAAGAIYSDYAGKIAVLAKSTRNAMIGFVVLGYAVYWASRGKAHAVQNKWAFVWQKFPKFVLGFLLVSTLATAGAFSKAQISSVANLSRWAFLFCFAGVGLKTDFREIKKQGLRPFVVGALGELTITIVTLGLVVGAAAMFKF